MWATIVIGGLVIGSMVLIVIHLIRKARKGESTCGCGCSGCSYASECRGHK